MYYTQCHCVCVYQIDTAVLCGHNHTCLCLLVHILVAAGGLYVGKHANVSISGSQLVENKAWSTGGALGTDMDGSSDDPSGAKLDGQQIGIITVDATFQNNTGLGFDLFVGPEFDLFAAGGARFDLSRRGIRWWRRRCEKGEYIGNSTYCEPCPPNTFLLTPGTEARKRCDKAHNTALAPGGAVLVPLSLHWHGSSDTITGLSCGHHAYCPVINMSLATITRWVELEHVDTVAVAIAWLGREGCIV
jgi:hypothetical protein